MRRVRHSAALISVSKVCRGMISKSLAVPYDSINDITQQLTKGQRAQLHLLALFAGSFLGSQFVSVLTQSTFLAACLILQSRACYQLVGLGLSAQQSACCSGCSSQFSSPPIALPWPARSPQNKAFLVTKIV